ncbi:MAG: hypothetical protein LBR51_04670 [Bacteroidales bacterium]|jgi:hypothetical protein|nr:hypothetical protein [Bacteroidales bacterium]
MDIESICTWHGFFIYIIQDTDTWDIIFKKCRIPFDTFGQSIPIPGYFIWVDYYFDGKKLEIVRVQ